MRNASGPPATIDAYIAASDGRVQEILCRIRETVRRAAPDAQEIISYRMPAFRQMGIVIYFSAFKNHIGLYPPIRDNRALIKAASWYAGEKGNLRFPLHEAIPYELIARIAKHNVRQNLARHRARKSDRHDRKKKPAGELNTRSSV